MNMPINLNSYLKDFDCFAISFREFLNWSAYGILRINRSRIHYFNGQQDTFSLIMDSSPDMDVNIKGKYLFVRLTSDYQRQIYQRTTTDYYLKLESVEQFFVTDDHAYQLLIGRANTAKLSLSLNDRLTRLAYNWIDDNKKILTDFKALRFMSILGFEEAEIDIEDNKSSHLDSFKNYILESHQEIYCNIEKYQGTLIYSYRFLNEYVKNICDLQSEDLRDYFDKNENFKALNNQLSKIDIAKGTELALSDYQYAFEERLGIESFIRQELGKGISDFLPMTLYVHYKTLIEQYFENLGEDIVITFARDLKKLQDIENDDKNAKVLAYEIGSLLPEVFVNHLYYAKNKEKFSALNDNLLDDVQKTLSNISTATYKVFSVHLSEQQESKENIEEYIITEEKVVENNTKGDAIVDKLLLATNQKALNTTELQEIIVEFSRNSKQNVYVNELMEHIHKINKSYSEQDVQSLYCHLFNDESSVRTSTGKLRKIFLQNFQKLSLEKNLNQSPKQYAIFGSTG